MTRKKGEEQGGRPEKIEEQGGRLEKIEEWGGFCLGTEGFEDWRKGTSRVGLGLVLKVPKAGEKRRAV